MMLWIAAGAACLATVMYGGRTGHIYDELKFWDRLARLSVGILMLSVILGLSARARSGDEFEWYHWFVLAAHVAMVASYTGLFWDAHRDKEKRHGNL